MVGSKPVDEVDQVLDKEGIPYSIVQTVEEVLKDPHYHAREMLVDVDHYGREVLPLVGPFPKLSLTPGSIRTVCPQLGQHNEEVYSGILGIPVEELSALKAEGVI